MGLWPREGGGLSLRGPPVRSFSSGRLLLGSATQSTHVLLVYKDNLVHDQYWFLSLYSSLFFLGMKGPIVPAAVQLKCASESLYRFLG